ncbi:hypothetical protein NM688_g4001 [Phlebia brevispora]|uniref:Uncharacterized protein n=1 Tax=Phlebia brevispora TaxID=194682 RepID=A0ACC1T4C8_9APHY|nr:hypothetical protein NM688_g4001 [Phlebia brevispora]
MQEYPSTPRRTATSSVALPESSYTQAPCSPPPCPQYLGLSDHHTSPNPFSAPSLSEPRHSEADSPAPFPGNITRSSFSSPSAAAFDTDFELQYPIYSQSSSISTAASINAPVLNAESALRPFSTLTAASTLLDLASSPSRPRQYKPFTFSPSPRSHAGNAKSRAYLRSPYASPVKASPFSYLQSQSEAPFNNGSQSSMFSTASPATYDGLLTSPDLGLPLDYRAWNQSRPPSFTFEQSPAFTYTSPQKRAITASPGLESYPGTSSPSRALEALEDESHSDDASSAWEHDESASEGGLLDQRVADEDGDIRVCGYRDFRSILLEDRMSSMGDMHHGSVPTSLNGPVGNTLRSTTPPSTRAIMGSPRRNTTPHREAAGTTLLISTHTSPSYTNAEETISPDASTGAKSIYCRLTASLSRNAHPIGASESPGPQSQAFSRGVKPKETARRRLRMRKADNSTALILDGHDKQVQDACLRSRSIHQVGSKSGADDEKLRVHVRVENAIVPLPLAGISKQLGVGIASSPSQVLRPSRIPSLAYPSFDSVDTPLSSGRRSRAFRATSKSLSTPATHTKVNGGFEDQQKQPPVFLHEKTKAEKLAALLTDLGTMKIPPQTTEMMTTHRLSLLPFHDFVSRHLRQMLAPIGSSPFSSPLSSLSSVASSPEKPLTSVEQARRSLVLPPFYSASEHSPGRFRVRRVTRHLGNAADEEVPISKQLAKSRTTDSLRIKLPPISSSRTTGSSRLGSHRPFLSSAKAWSDVSDAPPVRAAGSSRTPRTKQATQHGRSAVKDISSQMPLVLDTRAYARSPPRTRRQFVLPTKDDLDKRRPQGKPAPQRRGMVRAERHAARAQLKRKAAEREEQKMNKRQRLTGPALGEADSVDSDSVRGIDEKDERSETRNHLISCRYSESADIVYLIATDPSEIPKRTLPSDIPIRAVYPRWYRRFPIPTPVDESTMQLIGSLAGASYNAPRSQSDLYTPRFVKGRGASKVGLCPICVEPCTRGGEGKNLWLSMKFRISTTGTPFSPPIAFRTIKHISTSKYEKSQLVQGRCHKCKKWVNVEGVKDVEVKVPEIYWYILSSSSVTLTYMSYTLLYSTLLSSGSLCSRFALALHWDYDSLSRHGIPLGFLLALSCVALFALSPPSSLIAHLHLSQLAAARNVQFFAYHFSLQVVPDESDMLFPM